MRHRIAITSDAAVMSNSVCREEPLAAPPDDTTNIAQGAVVHIHHPAPR